MSHTKISTLFAALLIVSAILAPAAVARPIDTPVDRTSGFPSQADPGIPTIVDPSPSPSSSGFDWGDAAVGAAGMLVTVSLGAAGVTTIRRSRRRTGPVLTG